MAALGENTFKLLSAIGYSAEEINLWSSETRLLHDMGWCGDDIFDAARVFEREFGRSIKCRNVSIYFPSELSRDAWLVSIRPFLKWIGLEAVVLRAIAKYPEITLAQLEEIIK